MYQGLVLSIWRRRILRIQGVLKVARRNNIKTYFIYMNFVQTKLLFILIK